MIAISLMGSPVYRLTCGRSDQLSIKASVLISTRLVERICTHIHTHHVDQIKCAPGEKVAWERQRSRDWIFGGSFFALSLSSRFYVDTINDNVLLWAPNVHLLMASRLAVDEIARIYFYSVLATASSHIQRIKITFHLPLNHP